jgi:hypothetical protein
MMLLASRLGWRNHIVPMIVGVVATVVQVRTYSSLLKLKIALYGLTLKKIHCNQG